ncbi:MAG: hypothetical protein ABIH87_04460 [bacterium]
MALNLYNLQNKKPQAQNSAPYVPVPERVNLGEYIDPSGELGAGKLKAGLWFAKHKIFLYRLSVVSLVLVIATGWTFSLWKWGMFLLELPEQKVLEKQLISSIDYGGINIGFTAKPLQIVGVQVFSSGVNKYDAVAEITNPNERFVSSFDYHFEFGQEQTDTRAGFLLPGQTRPVAFMGIESGSHPGIPRLVMKNLSWQRIDTHEIKDTKNWQDYRLDFRVSNFKFIRSYSESGGQADAHIIKFTLTNSSPYNYQDVKFYVGMYNQSGFVGLLPIDFRYFKSLEQKQVDLRSYSPSLSADRVVAFPLINIYNQEIYIQPEK